MYFCIYISICLSCLIVNKDIPDVKCLCWMNGVFKITGYALCKIKFIIDDTSKCIIALLLCQ